MVREAAEADYPAIARIQQLCPEAAQWPVGDYSGAHVLLTDHGFCAWRQVADDEAELLNLAVEPAARRHGVATLLLTELRSRAQGAIYLEVAADNLAAIALYEALGWQRHSLRRGYYHRGEVDGIVMKNSSC